ncbi:MAG: DUF1566 domain-containing protein [Pseudomonadota bacterium]
MRLAIVPSLLLLASCELLGLGAVPCETDDNCPEGQHCSTQKVCLDGAASDAGSRDVAAADAAGDAASSDASAADQGAGQDAASGNDAGTGWACEMAPCIPMPDSRTLFCRLGDTDGPDSCPAVGTEMYGQDGTYDFPRPSYRDLGNGAIEDLVTGVQWEQVPPGAAGTYAAAQTRCENLSLASHDDWRLPTTAEVVGLLDFGTSSDAVALDPTFFPAPSTTGVWTTDGYNGFHWTVSQHRGDPVIQMDSGSYSYESRCARGEVGWQGNLRFTAGTYVDRRSGLQWQSQHTADQSLQQALALCEGLSLASHDDWRLPSLKEMETLVDRTDAHQSSPQTFAGIVDSTIANEYWTSTPATPPLYGFYTVSFDNGRHLSRYRSSSHYVRCVRGP